MRIQELISIKLFAEDKMKEESVDTRSFSPLNAHFHPHLQPSRASGYTYHSARLKKKNGWGWGGNKIQC